MAKKSEVLEAEMVQGEKKSGKKGKSATVTAGMSAAAVTSGSILSTAAAGLVKDYAEKKLQEGVENMAGIPQSPLLHQSDPSTASPVTSAKEEIMEATVLADQDEDLSSDSDWEILESSTIDLEIPDAPVAEAETTEDAGWETLEASTIEPEKAATEDSEWETLEASTIEPEPEVLPEETIDQELLEPLEVDNEPLMAEAELPVEEVEMVPEEVETEGLLVEAEPEILEEVTVDQELLEPLEMENDPLAASVDLPMPEEVEVLPEEVDVDIIEDLTANNVDTPHNFLDL